MPRWPGDVVLPSPAVHTWTAQRVRECSRRRSQASSGIRSIRIIQPHCPSLRAVKSGAPLTRGIWAPAGYSGRTGWPRKGTEAEKCVDSGAGSGAELDLPQSPCSWEVKAGIQRLGHLPTWPGTARGRAELAQPRRLYLHTGPSAVVANGRKVRPPPHPSLGTWPYSRAVPHPSKVALFWPVGSGYLHAPGRPRHGDRHRGSSGVEPPSWPCHSLAVSCSTSASFMRLLCRRGRKF